MRAQSQVGKFEDFYMAGSGASCKMSEKGIHLQKQDAEAKAARADEKAFTAMLKANQNIINKVCRLYTKDRTDHKDFFQEISYQLWRAYPSFENKSKASTWIYSVALKTGATIFRKRGRNVVDIHDALPDIPAESDDDGIDDETLALIRRQVPIDQSILLLMLDGYTNQDMAPIIGLSEEATAMRVLRLKRNNKDFFQE